MFKAEILSGSIHALTKKKIATYRITFPRFILAELNTHKMLMKNSASSRAIPFKKMVEAVKNNPFIPIAWQKDHSGMQGTEYITDANEIDNLIKIWLDGRDSAVAYAEALSHAGVTKQICNRPLEAYMFHTVIITGTEWENFFALRAQDMAEIHMQRIAYLMLEAWNSYDFKYLQPGEWHLPFGDLVTQSSVVNFLKKKNPEVGGIDYSLVDELRLKITSAMCARVSYTVVGEEDKEPDYDKDIILHDRLLTSGHMSPFEHAGRAMDNYELDRYVSGIIKSFRSTSDRDGKMISIDNLNEIRGWSAAFNSFIQYRKMLPEENKKDIRVQG